MAKCRKNIDDVLCRDRGASGTSPASDSLSCDDDDFTSLLLLVSTTKRIRINDFAIGRIESNHYREKFHYQYQILRHHQMHFLRVFSETKQTVFLSESSCFNVTLFTDNFFEFVSSFVGLSDDCFDAPSPLSSVALFDDDTASSIRRSRSLPPSILMTATNVRSSGSKYR